MTNPFEADGEDYGVLVNIEGEYSLWPAFRDAPHGWSAAGPRGLREDCLAFIELHWRDFRLQSLAERPLN